MAAVPTIVNCGGYCPRCFQFNDRAWSGRAAAAAGLWLWLWFMVIILWLWIGLSITLNISATCASSPVTDDEARCYNFTMNA